MKVFFISGLAADRRIFENIRLPQGYEIVHLDWISPQKNESLSAYAIRLGAAIDVKEPFAVAGLSMGGMIAAEIALHYKPAFTILVSSIPVSRHLPSYFRLGAKLGIAKILPDFFLRSPAIFKRLFSTETRYEKRMLNQMLRETDLAFIRWAIQAIVNWNNERYPSPYIHIHGSADRILPAAFTNPTHVIRNAGHSLILNRASELNEILKDYLKEVNHEKLE